MGITYQRAPDIDRRVQEIARALRMEHINERVVCVRSIGSRSKWTLARCYALPRALQAALEVKPHYVIEVVGHQFDTMPEPEQTKTLIHELLHIPKAFGGGLKSHRYVNSRKVNRLYRKLREHIRTPETDPGS
jgi:predicted metallopeptidase